MPRTRKGLLLTLATVVLLILMLAQIMTYVYTQITYSVLSSGVATSSAVTNFLTQMKGNLPSFLHTSLSNAMAALVTYESTPSLRYDNFTNNTAYALGSLMNNGTIYRTNMTSFMGNFILKNFLNTTIFQAQAQNVNVIITNVSISIYQTSPFIVNATLTGLAVVNSTQGSIRYPISATGSASLNGTWDLFYAEAADPHVIRAQQGYPVAVPIVNSPAASGSTSPFMLASGITITENGLPNCGSVPSGFQNGNYILVTQNAVNIPQNACGMAGLVTATANTATPLVPYLIYQANTATPGVVANVFSIVQNGTRVLLDGPALSLLNTSAVQLAIQNGYYYPSSLAPSYLGYGQGSLSQRSPSGMVSFNLYNRQVATFNGFAYVSSSASTMPAGSAARSVFAWVYPTGAAGSFYVVQSYGTPAGNQGAYLYINTAGNLAFDGYGNHLFSNLYLTQNAWHLVGYTYSAGSTSLTLYMDGQAYTGALESGALATVIPVNPIPAAIGAADEGGAGEGSLLGWKGSIASVQVYNTVVSAPQVSQMYLNGIDGAPVSNAGLVGWWPLNANYYDYSGKGQNGAASNVISTQLVNYAGDPAYGGGLYYNMTNKVLGAGNPGCTSLTNCGSNTLSAQLLLGSSPILGNYSGKAAKYTYGSGLGVASATNTPTGSAVTGVVWIKPYAPASAGCNFWPINLGPDSGTGSSFLLGIAQSSLRPALATWSNDYFPGSGPTLRSKSWNFVAGTVSGTTATIYVNNQSESGTLGATPNVQHGAMYSGFANQCANSSVADIQLYNSVLTTQQLQTLYSEGINGAPIPVNTLTDWWPLNGNATDYVNSKNNMVNSYVAYTSQYTNQTGGTSSGLAALHLADAAIPNAALMYCTGTVGANGCTGQYGYAQTVASSIFNPSKISVSFWMNARQLNSGSSTFVLSNSNPGNAGWNWGFEFGSSGSLNFHSCNTNCNGASVGSSNANQWYFITGVFDGSNWYLYRNGTLVGSCTSSCSTMGGSGSDMMFGTDACNGCVGSGDNNGFYNGYLSDVRLYYGTALTASQVQQLYQNDSVAGISANDIWPLNGAGFSSASAANQVVDIANSLNSGYMYSNTIVCTLANAITRQCGVYFTQP